MPALADAYFNNWAAIYVKRFGLANYEGKSMAMLLEWVPELREMEVTIEEMAAAVNMVAVKTPATDAGHRVAFFGALRSIRARRTEAERLGNRKAENVNAAPSSEVRSEIAKLRERWTRDGYAWRNGKTRKAVVGG